MSVDIQRERCGSMSQIVLYGLNIVPAFQRSNCISVSEIIESLVFDPKIFDDPFVVVVHRRVTKVILVL